MPIKMINVEGGAGPIVICDVCGDRIEEASEGNYEWDGDDYLTGALHDVYFIHKKCSNAHERQRGKPLDTMELASCSRTLRTT